MNVEGRLKKLEGNAPPDDSGFCRCPENAKGCDVYVKSVGDRCLLAGPGDESDAPVYDPDRVKICDVCAKPTNKPVIIIEGVEAPPDLRI